MPNYRNKNVTVTAPTAVERVQLFVDAFGTYNEAITSHRDYEYPYGAVRTVTRTPLLTADLVEILRLARIADALCFCTPNEPGHVHVDDDEGEEPDYEDDPFWSPSAEEGNVPNYNNSRYL